MRAVKVLGRRVPIKRKAGLIDLNCAAFYDFETHSITIDSALSKDEYIAALVHEIGHALFARGGLQQIQLPHGIEEIIVEQFATVICENFKLTPKK